MTISWCQFKTIKREYSTEGSKYNLSFIKNNCRNSSLISFLLGNSWTNSLQRKVPKEHKPPKVKPSGATQPSQPCPEGEAYVTKHHRKIVSLDNLHITLSAKNKVTTPILVKLTDEICGIIRILVYPVKGLPINPAKLYWTFPNELVDFMLLPLNLVENQVIPQ